MDDIVKQAMAKWPDVPDCYGWLGLDSRGHWHMRDDRVQRLGLFQSAVPGAKGSVLTHEKLLAFIHRNYASNEKGQWFFQNGPQRVYVELALTPYVWRLDDACTPTAQTGEVTRVRACLMDEVGRVYLDTDLGLGLVHSMDVAHVANALEQGRWTLMDCESQDLPQRYGYVISPQALAQAQRA
ncbi:DUF2946 family protein [Limnohabitans sp. G3-2]|uniref:DUF2946 family protein n=1 Tax=Limnohabitans sp. G3-2 TaxID=1100711 RepID=UPI000C1E7A7F|nr:DUF2946 family protein [Limnohabitans sp. G3-2]PIT72210.1 hypothetical protein B9Z31_14040 [Limnohabitans sp. G3-2]